jgi:hypothetical protein
LITTHVAASRVDNATRQHVLNPVSLSCAQNGGQFAIAGAADSIVTRNLRDFRAMDLRFPTLLVLSPEDQLKEI